MRTKARKDANQAEIVERLKKELPECSIQSLHNVGRGVPDLLVGYKDRNFLFEIKSQRFANLTNSQIDWHMAWKGQINVVVNFDTVLDILLRETK